MKQKILKLSLLFLLMGLLGSSKENTGEYKVNCRLHCKEALLVPAATTAINEVKAVKEECETNPFALAPGSYLFVY